MKRIFLILFLAAAVVELISEVSWKAALHQIAKPAIMLALGAYYVVAAKEGRSMIVLLAILLSWAGDVLLMDPDWFIPGLAAFLLSHISYILAYRQHQQMESAERPLGSIHKVRLAFPIILAGSGLVVILYPVLGDLKVPVMVYAAVITTMVLQALFRFGKTSAASFWLVFTGALLFMISDSILAINKFLIPIPFSGVWIMTTYILAQFLIISGLLRHPPMEAVA